MKNLLITMSLMSVLLGCSQKTAQEHFVNAQHALKNGQIDFAIIELKNAAQLSPKDEKIRFLLGKVYFELGQLPQAQKELERALNEGYAVNEIIPLLSKVYQRTGENKKLFQLTEKVKGLKSKDLAQLKFYQLQSYVGVGNDEKANALIQELKQIQQGGEFTQLAFAYDFIIKQQFDKAITQLEQILIQYPNQYETLKIKAQLHLNTRQPEKATETYQAFINAYPSDNEVKFLLARLYSELRLTNKAEPIIDELLAEFKSHPLLLQLKASARVNQSDYKMALQFAEQALERNLEDTPSRLIAGVSAYFLQDFDKTNRHLSFIASMLPTSHFALRALADAQVKLGLTLDANETVQRFEELTEEDAVLLSNVGLALLKEGEHNKAKSILEKQPGSIEQPNIKLSVAQLKLSLNDVSGILDLEQALDSLQNANEVPANLDTMKLETTLAQAYFSSGQFEKALKIAKRWQKSQNVPVKVKGFVIEAKVLERQNIKHLAKVAYQNALVIDPASPGLALALIPFEHEKLSDQLTAIEGLLELHPQNLPIILKHYLTTKLLNHPEQMTAYLTKLLKQQPDDLMLKGTLAKMWLLEKQPRRAIEVFEEIKQSTNNQAAGFWVQLADSYIQTKRYDDAVTLYEQWFDQQPNQPEAVVGIIKALQIQGKSQEALEMAEQYLKNIHNNNYEVQLLRLYILSKLGRFSLLEQGITSLPDSLQSLPHVQGLKGQVLFFQGNVSEAISGLQVAYKATPSPANTMWLYRALSNGQGQQSAQNFLEQHIDKQPNDESSLLALAEITTTSNLTKAQSLYKQIVKLNPNNFIAHNNLANLLSQNGNNKEAYQHAQKAYELKPDEGAVLDTLGGIELKLNKNKDALTHMQASVDKLKGKVNDQVMLNYLEALYRNQLYTLARRRSEQYTFTTPEGRETFKQLKLRYKH